MKMRVATTIIAVLLSEPFGAQAQSLNTVPNFLGPRDVSGIEAMDANRGIKFLTTLDFPPFSFLDPNGKLSGLNVYLAKLICTELKIEMNCTVQALPWEQLEAALAQGQGNAIISGIASTENSRSAFSFSKPYLRLPARFVASKKSDGKFDFDRGLNGARIGVVAKSAYQALAGSYFPEATITGFANDDLLLADLESGKIDLAFGDAMRLSFFLATANGEACCRFMGGPYYSPVFLGEGMRIAVAAGDDRLSKQLDHALVSLQRKGKIEELYLRFFPNGFY